MGYYLNRTGQALFTIYAVVTLSFVLIRWLPGGPLDFIRAQILSQTEGLSQEKQMERVNELTQIYTNIRPDRPLWAQYLDYMAATLTGDLGRSTWFNEPVADIFAKAVPWTLFLSSVALLVSFTTGVILGAVMAYFEGSKFDFASTAGLLVSHAVPYYVAALLLLFVFGFQLGWFPTGGRMSPHVRPGLNYPFLADVLYHAALPLISLILTGIGSGALSMRGNSIRILGEDYLRVARIRGLPVSRISTMYISRNAVLPLYTGLLIRIGALIGGSVILERIFAYPGVGFFLFRGFQARDYPVMMGGFLIITTAVVVGVYIADLTYSIIDPRIQRGGEHESF